MVIPCSLFSSFRDVLKLNALFARHGFILAMQRFAWGRLRGTTRINAQKSFIILSIVIPLFRHNFSQQFCRSCIVDVIRMSSVPSHPSEARVGHSVSEEK